MTSLKERLLLLGYKKKSLHANLIAFQNDFKISAEIKLHDLTIPRLKELTSGNTPLNLLARTIYSENRGEPYRGMVAVGAVVLNRLKSHQFPNPLVKVITEPLAFTVVSNGQFWLKPNRRAYRTAREAMKGNDPTAGSLYFFNPDKSTSTWVKRLQLKLRIGRHEFA
ncbi:cell wall hydrolase [Paenibacillus illinoisensis]|uniref:Spore cortex-lytic protein n=1 Tax=Paenibacillus illinoisensis TaxID=59845 RepID=A0A2W0C2E3_9BACL|nr:cell wall hydrolase [Paenibacillus illinoisensis]PYY25904.1 Spore cortex-lytic protein [Paenibacillus illinoisensis]